jgi:hypothetical protein
MFTHAAVAPASAVPVPPDHAERMGKGLQSFDAQIAGILREHCLDCHGGSKTRGARTVRP